MLAKLRGMLGSIWIGPEQELAADEWAQSPRCTLVYSGSSWTVECSVHELAEIMSEAQRENRFVTLISGKLCVNPHQFQMIVSVPATP